MALSGQPASLALSGHLSFEQQTSSGRHASAVRFEEVARQAGVAFTLHHDPTPDKRLIETMPGGLAILDADGDGRPDIFFTNGAAGSGFDKTDPRFWNRLYRNEGNWRFTDVTGTAGLAGQGYSIGAAAADYDNDGDQDLFVAGVRGNQLYRNDGRGRFDEVSARAGIRSEVWSVAGAWFDYDRDGHLDLLVVNYLRWEAAAERERFCGDRARGLRVYCHPKYYEGLPNTLYRNRGDGTFEDVSERSGIGRVVGKGMSVAVDDFDGDGWLDAYVTNDGVPSVLFRNRGDGTFEELGLLAGVAVPAHGRPVSAMGVEAGDYDGDGRPDLAITALSGETFPLFRNEGEGLFREAGVASGLNQLTVRHSGWGIVLADLNNDGARDLFTANSHVNDLVEAFESSVYLEPNRVFLNTGDGRFRDVSATAGDALQRAAAHRGAAAADLDGDGRLDIVTTALGTPAAIWRNVTEPRRHWIAVRLAGRAPRDGIGARVRIGSQVETISTATSYASSRPPIAHFGLGENVEPPEIVVTWPDGSTQTVKADGIDRVVEISREK
jgi:hypothetical protein